MTKTEAPDVESPGSFWETPSIRYSNPASTQLSLADSLSPIKTDLQPRSGAAGQRFSLEAEAGGSSACVKVALLSTASERWWFSTDVCGTKCLEAHSAL